MSMKGRQFRHSVDVRMRIDFHRLFPLLMWMAFFSPWVHAQTYSSSLTGVVTDPSGAVIPNAAVRLIDEGKGFTFSAATDATGRYVFRNLPPSAYRLSAQAPGFQGYIQEGITLDVQQNAVVDVALKLGSTAQNVEVNAAAPLLATQDAVTGQEVDRTLMNDLPLIGRSAYELAFRPPGGNAQQSVPEWLDPSHRQ